MIKLKYILLTVLEIIGAIPIIFFSLLLTLVAVNLVAIIFVFSLACFWGYHELMLTYTLGVANAMFIVFVIYTAYQTIKSAKD